MVSAAMFGLSILAAPLLAAPPDCLNTQALERAIDAAPAAVKERFEQTLRDKLISATITKFAWGPTVPKGYSRARKVQIEAVSQSSLKTPFALGTDSEGPKGLWVLVDSLRGPKERDNEGNSAGNLCLASMHFLTMTDAVDAPRIFNVPQNFPIASILADPRAFHLEFEF